MLRQRRVAIDPGHGGVFPGSVGQAGLRECDVNLDVARLLAAHLQDAGAAVLLTREADSDFVGRDSTRLRDDLEARVQLSNAFRPDVFLSIHHNGDANHDTSRDAIETYYRMLDPGASLDAASHLHQRLEESQGTPRAELIPGNYYVLRRSTAAAAILGEASYLSHPATEQLLLQPERRALEAGAYYQGLVDYFRAGVPRLAAMDPVAPVLDTLPAALTAEIEDGAGGAQLDPVSLQVFLDDKPLPAPVMERLAAARPDTSDTAAPAVGRVRVSAPLPPDLPNGPHTWSLQARNLNGNALTARERAFELQGAVASLGVRTIPPSISLLGRTGGDMFEVAVEAADARDVPVHRTDGKLYISNGWFVLPDGDFIRDSIPFTLTDGAFHAVVRLSAHSSRDIEIRTRVGPLVARATDPEVAPLGTWFLVYAKTLCGDHTCALPGAAVLWDGRVVGRTDGSGMLAVRTDVHPGRLDSLELAAPGHLRRKYIVNSALTDYTVDLGSGYTTAGSWPYFVFDQAVLPEIPEAALLRGLRVALDPLGPKLGGESGEVEGGADLNFQVARALKASLEAVGAEVMLTRGPGDSPSAVGRLRAIESFGAQRVLLI
ncbi:MAG TPA: N-acetylmuramoyl-L-alanine amidase, partial [Candidatus Saccharimonadales bacterium]|nr:N-acetylmuramoyl-L-alanine amidase [Candidatus Saccharimonadales bacterium]